MRVRTQTCAPLFSFDPDTHLLHPSKAQFLKRPARLSTVVLQVLAGLGFTELTTLPDGTVLETTNLTILNVLLLRLGPMREKRLTQALIVVQVIHCYLRRVVWTSSLTIYCQVMGSIVAFVVRYGLAYLVYDGDRR